MEPLITEIPYLDPITLVDGLPSDKDFVFLDSSTSLGKNDRYSFIAFDPFSIISCNEGQVDINGVIFDKSPLAVLSDQLKLFQTDSHRVLPFRGGLVGYLGYECVNYVEPKLKLPKKNTRGVPDFILGAFDLTIAFDHMLQQCWVISTGLPETTESSQGARARERSEFLLEIISRPSSHSDAYSPTIEEASITSNMTYKEYCASIEKVLGYIEAGDIYQANIAQRFECKLPPNLSPLTIYKRLRNKNPAPFSAFVKLKGNFIASASPERFLKVKDRQVMTCPIKGTSKRDDDATRDQQLANTLLQCEKNKAENLMIVDLMRNDLSRVCELYSIKVPELFSLESYATVHHLVSTIAGKLKKEYDLIDLIIAAFPGGSITGAPKKRAIEIIDEIEAHPRGPYCGTIGYLGFDGGMDSSIIIRTFVIKDNLLTFHVGGGIVADSRPHDEYVETLIKANALYASLTENEMDLEKWASPILE